MTASPKPIALKVLADFNNTDGSAPDGDVLFDFDDNLIGTTYTGGANSDGTVFEVPFTGTGYASTPKVLVSFNITDGRYPVGSLIPDGNGDLFGTTSYGGANNVGEVFEVTFNSGNGSYASTPTVLASFNGTDGSHPQGSLIADATGNLFGTTSAGGSSGDGAVFEIVDNGGSYGSTPTVVASFDGTDGSAPRGSLITDANGDLFGTTYEGGASSDGTVFEIVKTATGYATTPRRWSPSTAPTAPSPREA